MMVWFSGLNKKSDNSGFIVVYPSGTGVGPFRTWNAGGYSGKMAEGKAGKDGAEVVLIVIEDGGAYLAGTPTTCIPQPGTRPAALGAHSLVRYRCRHGQGRVRPRLSGPGRATESPGRRQGAARQEGRRRQRSGASSAAV